MDSTTINLAKYIRISTDKQDNNTSKKTQLDAIDKYINEHKIIVNKEYLYQDTYSASRKPKSSNIDDDKPFTRRGLNDLINDAKLKKFDTVAVFTHDRLTRNVQESLLLKFFFKKLNINVIFCKPGEKLDSESEKINIFFENLLNNLSALESNMIGSRTKLGNEYNVRHNYWPGGTVPYGFKLSKIHPGSEKSILKISYSEARIVKEIFNLYLQGMSPVKIAEHIKIKYKNNTDRKWTKNSIISIVNNQDYTGIIVWDKKGGVRNPVKHKNAIYSNKNDDAVIIEEELWEQIKEIKDLKKKRPKFFSTPFLLSGYLVCGKCGRMMRTKNNGGKKGRVYYCIKEKGSWESCIDAEKIEDTIIKILGERLTFVLNNDENFNKLYEKYKADFNFRKIMYEKASAELQLQIDENSNYLIECESQINNLEKLLNYSNKDKHDTNLNFIESLKELHSYLKINENIITERKRDIDNNAKADVINKEDFQRFISQKKNLLDSIEARIEDKDMYRRSLKLLLYDLVDKIIYNDDKNIDIIIK